MLIKIILICYKDTLNNIFQNNEKVISDIITNFNYSFKNFNYFNKLIISFYLLLILFSNFIFILIFFFKLKLNHLSTSRRFLCKFLYFKNIDSFIKANLLLHHE